VSECDRQASTKRRPCPTGGCNAIKITLTWILGFATVFKMTLVQSSRGTVSFAEAKQLEREADHYRVMSGATNKIHIFVDHKYIYCLAPLRVSVFSAICRQTTLIATGR
jgi:hypothetical protein